MASIDLGSMKHGQELLKRGFATMQEGGVIMDVVNAEEAAVAEESGAVAVMALGTSSCRHKISRRRG